MYGDTGQTQPHQGPSHQPHQSYQYRNNAGPNDYRNANTSTKSSQSYSSSRMSNEEAAARKAVSDTQFFWQQVSRFSNQKAYGYGRAGAGSNKQTNKAYEEAQLFGPQNHQQPSPDLIQGVTESVIPVERSGPRADEIPILEAFSELESLPEFAQRNIQLMRYEKPTPIQKHSVPLGLAGVDLMCCAQTGSGKTFAFLLPTITALYTSATAAAAAAAGTNGNDGAAENGAGNGAETSGEIPLPRAIKTVDEERGCLPRAIILAPTRELACQIHLEARKLCFGSGLKTVVVYGGSDIRAQLTELSTGCDIIVATPGRLNDLVDRGCVSFYQVEFLVLDEADRMLDMGFEPQIRRIVQEYDMPPKDTRQTFLFSATFPDEIQTLAREFLRDYVWIGVGRVGSTVENITQRLVLASADSNMKMNLLLNSIQETEGRTLVFVQKKKTAVWVCQCLNQYGVSSEEIHGDRSQAQREHALRQFRHGRTRVLVATDVAARGLDIPAITHVIQFDMPISSEDFDTYVHRIGRTGRAGKNGIATSFYVPGRETGEGNGKIATLIMRLLQENNQDIPDWFANCEDLQGGSGGGSNYRGRPSFQQQRGGYGSNNYGGGGGRFGGRDVRGYSSLSAPSAAYGGYGQQQQQRNGGVPGGPPSGGGYPRPQNQQQQGGAGAPPRGSGYSTGTTTTEAGIANSAYSNTPKQQPDGGQQIGATTYYGQQAGGNRGGLQQQGQYTPRNNGMQQSVRFQNQQPQAMGSPYGATGVVSQVGMPAVVAYDPYTMTYVTQQGGEMAGQGQSGVTMVAIDGLAGQMGQMNIAQRSADGSVPVAAGTAVDPNSAAAYGMTMPVPPGAGGDVVGMNRMQAPPMVGHGYPQMYLAQQAGMVQGMYDPSMLAAAQQGAAMMYPGQQQGGYNNYQRGGGYGNGRMDSAGGRRSAVAGGQYGGRGMGAQQGYGYNGIPRQQGIGGADGYGNAQSMGGGGYVRNNNYRVGGHGNVGNQYGAEHHNANGGVSADVPTATSGEATGEPCN